MPEPAPAEAPEGPTADGRVLARGVLSVTGARFLGLVFTLVQVKLTVSHLGVSDYGLLMTATLFISLMGVWTEMGVGTVVVRRVSAGLSTLRHEVGLSLGLTMALVVPMVVVTNGAGWLLYRGQGVVVEGIAILTVGLLLRSWATCYQPVAQVTSRFGHLSAADLTGRIASLALVAVAVATDGGLWWFFAAQLMLPLGQLVAMLLVSRATGPYRPLWAPRELRRLVRETIPLTYIMMVGVLYFTIDGLLLTKLAPPEEVGAYGFAYRTVGQVTIVATTLAQVLASRFAAEAAASPAAFAAVVRTSLRATVMVAAGFALAVIPISAELIRFAGSESLVPLASSPMMLLAVAVSIGMVSAVLSTALIADHHQGVLTRLNTVTLLINIGANLVLIPMLQATGAAAALVLTEVIGLCAATWLLSRRVTGIIPVRALLVLPVLVAVTLGVAVVTDELAWPLRLLVVLCSYLALLLLSRLTSISELRSLRPSVLEPR